MRVMLKRTPEQLRRDALEIWQAGVEAVKSETLVREAVRVERGQLELGDPGDAGFEPIELADIRRIAVVGAGKAGAGMAAALEQALGPRVLAEKQLAGWVNVPEDCVRKLARIHLHGARPAGLNEPTEAGVAGTREILKLVEGLGPDDLCLCLISGGGSALLPAPVEGITLADKQAVTRHLSGAGATIGELNTVRKQLSRIKGGGLARSCRAGRLVTLIISDVIGDPLDVIASGPTVPDTATARDALAVLEKFGARAAGISPEVFAFLESRAASGGPAGGTPAPQPTAKIVNLVIGNNARAVEAAGLEAARRGYQPTLSSATEPEGLADDVGRNLAHRAVALHDRPGPDCLISGGEPVVKLCPSGERGKGGRNQQLVLAALAELWRDELWVPGGAQVAILSGGTDGEDGPTDAAGALVDPAIIRQRGKLPDPAGHLARNDAYRYWEPLGALVRTGPTHTNVMDLRVVVVDRIAR